MNDDPSLLREYAAHRSEPAFAALVARHLGLVYSVALRQVRDPHLAEEVTQAVFILLARKADALGGQIILSGWLCRTARYVCADVLKNQRRRQQREQDAHMQHLLNEPDAAEPWPHIAAHLDDAMAKLAAKDHDALVLRYFENKNFAEVGAALGASEDAAKMRVSRALEKLRKFFNQRGLTLSTGAIAAAVAANSVQSAPVGLAVTVTTAALSGTTLTTAAVIAATKTIAMTTLQKTLVTAALAVLAGAGIYEARQAAQLREQNQTPQQQQAPLAEQNRQLQRERDEATNRLAALEADIFHLRTNPNERELLKLRGEVARLKSAEAQAAGDPAKAAAKSWADRVTQLKQRLEVTPEAKIPELQFLSEQDWLDAAKGNLDTEVDYRRALSSLRNAAESHFASTLNDALGKFSQANNKQFPTDLGQLQPYFDSPVENSILQRWEIVPASAIPNLGFGDFLITQKEPVDDMFDMRSGVGPNGAGSVDFLTTETQQIMVPIYRAYAAANNGQAFTDLSQLQPYATTPEQQTALQKLIQRGALNR